MIDAPFRWSACVLLTLLAEGERATVLQLPADPKTADERENQKRAAYVG